MGTRTNPAENSPTGPGRRRQLVASDSGVVWLDDAFQPDPLVLGGKASALAGGNAAGLPVLPGFVITTAGVDEWRPQGPAPALLADVRRAWDRLSSGGQIPVVARSSSPHEDTESSSLAGQFRSVLNLRTWSEFLAAVGDVVDSAGGGPMAVLVQPFLEPAWGGVLFGADPVTGVTDRLVVAAVPGGPDRLVSGEVSGSHFSLSPRGRLLGDSDPVPTPLVNGPVRRGLARLARRATEIFGGPQDIEWALRDDGSLVLLQARPITAIGCDAAVSGPVLGPGPVAETFPAALSSLEEDLWIPPLRDGLREALRLLAAAPARQLRRSPVVVTIDGRAAVDLDLLGVSPVKRSWLAALDPRPAARRMVAAWRVGRLRAALPGLASDILTEVDRQLASVPPLGELTPTQLVSILDRSAAVLHSLHGYEVLAGQLLPGGSTAPTAASRALRVLADARLDDPTEDDEALVARHPVLLSLSPPAIGALAPLPRDLPARAGTGSVGPRGEMDLESTVRESLRLRIRWVHELTARLSVALGEELVRRGVLAQPLHVRQLHLSDLRGALAGTRHRANGADVTVVLSDDNHGEDVIGDDGSGEVAPLPSAFRRAGDVIVPVLPRRRDGNGRGAGGGQGSGRVYQGVGPPPEGAVLVVGSLDPALAVHLPRLSGLVAETGSVLSHLAILAREHGVPAVVDLPGAKQRFTEGTWVVVDGTTGEVAPVSAEEWRAA